MDSSCCVDGDLCCGNGHDGDAHIMPGGNGRGGGWR